MHLYYSQQNDYITSVILIIKKIDFDSEIWIPELHFLLYKKIPLHVQVDLLDAGTQGGLTFTAPRWRLQVPKPVERITSRNPSHRAASFYYPELNSLPAIATFSIEKVRILSAHAAKELIFLNIKWNYYCMGWIWTFRGSFQGGGIAFSDGRYRWFVLSNEHLCRNNLLRIRIFE